MPFYAWQAVSRLAALLIAVSLSACAAVDQFGSRMHDGNVNSQSANDQETLLNIVRASRHRALTFVAISQISGGQTETLSTGLPTVTFGPGLTPAQHIYSVSNSVSSAVNGTYQSAPLVSTAFESGMLSPIPLSTMAYLVSSHPREPVLYAGVEAIIFWKGPNEVYRLRNNPEQNTGAVDCSEIRYPLANETFKRVANDCSYTLFVYYMRALVTAGLTLELIDQPASTAAKKKVKKAARETVGAGGTTTKDDGNSSDSKPPPKQGHFCFNPTNAAIARTLVVCQGELLNPAQVPSVVTYPFEGLGRVAVRLEMRSPLGIYSYLGALMRAGEPAWTNYETLEGQRLVRNGADPFLDIMIGGGPCFTAVYYEGTSYCVPASSDHTALLFDILEQLKNMSTTPSDLNAAFSVRLVGG